MTSRLKIWIDPVVGVPHAAEICWSWKTLLSAAGIPWERVGTPADADIVYTTQPVATPSHRAQHTMRASAERWRHPADAQLAAVQRADELDPPVEWHVPLYHGEARDQRPLVRTDDAAWLCDRDLIFDVYWFLTRQSETVLQRDAHGRLDLTASPLLTDGVLCKAVASSILARLEVLLVSLFPGEPVPRWPTGKKAAACASHDVDYPEVIRWIEPLRIVRRNGWRSTGTAVGVAVGRRSHWQFDAWIEAESALRTRSAFYFVPRKGSLVEYASGTPDPFYDISTPKFAAAFRRLTDAGFEVGLHASYRAFEHVERFAAEKERLARVSGQPVDGGRHHYWHLNPANPEETLLMHEQVGLKYDASVSHERYLGWRAGTNIPYFPFSEVKRRSVATLQLPTGWMDDQLFSYRSINTGDRQARLTELHRTVVAHGGLMMIDVHDYVFDDTLFPLWASTYLDFWGRVAADSDIWIAPPREIAAHWRARQQTLESLSVGL